MNDKPLRMITFVDTGQDFVEWIINDQGVIVDCRPFQAWAWLGNRVINTDVQPGEHVRINAKAFGGQPFTIKHIVESNVPVQSDFIIDHPTLQKEHCHV